MSNMPSGARKYHESTELEKREMVKILFYLSSSSSTSSDGLVQNCVTLLQLFLHRTAAHRFHNFFTI